MAFDNLCKYLAETYPADFAEWLLGEPLPNVKVLKTELSIEPIRADSVTFLRGTNRILHLEFQTETASEPALPLRMLDYWVRLYRKHELPITQIVIFLRETNAEISSVFEFERTRHEFEIVKMWEQEPAPLINNEHLLPLATLAKTTDKSALLQSIAEQIRQVENKNLRSGLFTQANVLAGLRFDEKLINLLLKENFMRESVTYQAILQEGREEGLLQGLEKGLERGLAEGKKREMKLIFQLLEHHLGQKIETKTRKKIEQLSFAELEKLGIAFFDFNSPEDLQTWLNQK